MAKPMTVRGHFDKITCPTLLISGEFDPPCPLEDVVEAFEHPKMPREMWVSENQYRPLRGIANLGGMDCHDYVLDRLQSVLLGKALPKKHRRIDYVKENGDGPWGKCECTPPIKRGQAHF